MWTVELESAKVEHEVLRLVKSGVISHEDKLVIAAWIRQISLEGPKSVQGDKRWSDHELYREWKGHRSSCYSREGRIIYRIEDKVIKILIARITPDHDYEKEKK